MDYYKKYSKYKIKYLNQIKNNFLPNYFQKAYRDFRYSLMQSNSHPFSPEKIQHGGGSKMHTWTYNNKKYTFKVKTISDEYATDIAVISKNNKRCIIASVSKEIALASITNISYKNDCAQEGLESPGGGDKLVRFMIYYLKKYKNEYNIKRINLTDISFKLCEGCSSHNVKLVELRMITHGEPWYMKYGFKFYDKINNKPDNELHLALDYNNETLKTLKTSKINIKKILKKIIDDKKNINEKIINNTIMLSKKYTLMKDFVIRLSKDFDNYCCVIIYILNDLYKGPPFGQALLYNFYNHGYYLDI